MTDMKEMVIEMISHLEMTETLAEIKTDEAMIEAMAFQTVVCFILFYVALL